MTALNWFERTNWTNWYLYDDDDHITCFINAEARDVDKDGDDQQGTKDDADDDDGGRNEFLGRLFRVFDRFHACFVPPIAVMIFFLVFCFAFAFVGISCRTLFLPTP